jgi:hypothetical protein
VRYEVKCTYPGCSSVVWIRGSDDRETNAIELNENDDNWAEACEHIQAGNYEIDNVEADDSED